MIRITDVGIAGLILVGSATHGTIIATGGYEQPSAILTTARREHLFAAMVRNTETPIAFFQLPLNRVVELGSQVEI